MVDVSVVIPAYNESSRIKPTLEHILSYLEDKPWSSEVIVVDDGSKDDTVEVVKSFKKVKLIRQPRNQGKGAAVKVGMMKAKGEVRVFCDADLATPIEELGRFMPIRDKADILIGSRNAPGAQATRISSFRSFLGRSFNMLVQILLVPGVSDTQCGFKMFSADAVQKVFPKQRMNGFAFDVELLHIARKQRLKIKEVPIRWVDQAGSTVKWREPLRMFSEILRIRIDSWMGKYK